MDKTENIKNEITEAIMTVIEKHYPDIKSAAVNYRISGPTVHLENNVFCAKDETHINKPGI